MLLAVAWAQSGRPSLLAAAAFCCGLAFWDKAVFAWIFAGLCAGSLVFAKSIFTRLTLRTVVPAIAALLTGALPLIVYNLAGEPRFSTVKSNSHFTTIPWAAGWNSFRTTSDGSILNGLPRDAAPQPGLPRGLVDRASFALHSMVGDRSRNLMEPALITALVLLPFLWRTRARNPMLFALIAIIVGWTFMLVSSGGLSAHHMVLLWPLPIFFLAIAFAEASLRSRYGKELLAAAVMVLACTNLLVTNQYLYRFTRYGSAVAWTDAIYPLAAGLAKTHASQVVLPDWGLADQLCVLNRNQPPSHQIAFPFMPPGDPPAQRKADLDTLADEKAIWVEHSANDEVFKGAAARAREAAREAGFTPVMLDTYYDRYGRAIFQSYCLRRPR